MPSSRLVATLLPLLAVALPTWAQEDSLQIIGWSADEQSFAVRLYTGESSDMEGEEPFCPGYMNHWFPIQDSGKCTPPKKARERLEKAKKELATLGVDLKQKKPGTELTPDKDGHLTLKEGPGARTPSSPSSR